MQSALKIYGLFVFGILTAAISFSAIKINAVNAELKLVSGTYLPLAQLAHRVDRLILEEELALERAEKFEAELQLDRIQTMPPGQVLSVNASGQKGFDLVPADLTLAEADQTQYETYARSIRTLIGTAEKHVKAAQSEARALETKLRLGALYLGIVSIEGRYAAFHDTLLKRGSTAFPHASKREFFNNELDVEKQKLSQHLNHFRSQVDNYARESVAAAHRHEAQAAHAGIASAAAAVGFVLLLFALLTADKRRLESTTKTRNSKPFVAGNFLSFKPGAGLVPADLVEDGYART